MALNPLSKVVNIKRSLDKYIYDNIYTTEGIDVDIEGLNFEESVHNEWIAPRILDIEPRFHRQGSSTQYAERFGWNRTGIGQSNHSAGLGCDRSNYQLFV